MKSGKIIVLESNPAALKQLKEAIEGQRELQLVYAGDDGDEGIGQISGNNVDLLIVSMFLKGTDGCGVIRFVKKN